MGPFSNILICRIHYWFDWHCYFDPFGGRYLFYTADIYLVEHKVHTHAVRGLFFASSSSFSTETNKIENKLFEWQIGAFEVE